MRVVLSVKGVDAFLDVSLELDEKIQKAVQNHSAGIVRVAFAFVKNLSDAEDIAQDVFLTYMQKCPAFSGEEHEKAWLFRVAVNKSKDFLKSCWKKRVVPLTDDLSYMPREDFMLLKTVLELNEKYRLPIYLYYFHDLSIKEIAYMLRTNPSTVGTRLERGRRIMKDKLGDDYYE